MPGYLPPGLNGFALAQQNSRQGDAQALQQALGVLNMQHMARQQQMEEELNPLKIAQMQQAAADAKTNSDIRQKFFGMLGGQGGATGATEPALGVGGMSTPGGGQANALTGQTLPPRQGALSQGGVPPGVNPMAFLAALTEKDLGKVGTMIQEANKPIAAREGAPVINPATGEILFYAPKLETGMQPQFQGGQVTGVSNLPGYIPAMAERTRSQEETKGQFSFQNVPVPGGGTQMMTTTGASQALAGGQQQTRPAETPQAAQIQASLATIPYIPPAQQRQTQANMDAGLTPSGAGPAIPSAGVLGRSQTPAETAGATTVAKERAEGGVKFEQSVLDAGRSAQNNLTQLQILAPNLEKMPTGPLFNTMLGGAALFKQFGVDVGEIGKQVGPAQASEAILNRMALAVRNPAGGEGMPGAMSDQDREFLSKTIPSLSKVPDGNRLLIKIMSALEQRKVEEAAIVNKMQSANMNSNQIRTALSQYGNRNSISAGLR